MAIPILTRGGMARMADVEICRSCVTSERFYFKVRCEATCDCVVCLDTLHRRPVLYTPCGHRFHAACIRQWLKAKETCPMCRYILDPKPHVILELRELIDILTDLLAQSDSVLDQS